MPAPRLRLETLDLGSRSSLIGPITLDVKLCRAHSAENPHATCDVGRGWKPVPCQCRNKTPAFLPVLTTAAAGLRRTAGSSFLLTSSENYPTIEDGRRSGGDCWRAPPRNTRLDSSRTMGGAQATAPDLKHIGPIDPDAFTLNQFLNRWPYARLRIFSWTAERFRLRSLRTAALDAPAGPQAPDSRTGDQERDAGSPTRTVRHCSCSGSGSMRGEASCLF